jgi:2-methylcitrate dehydratase PrpD
VAPMAEPNVRRRDPRTPTEAKFSLNYCLAVALVHGGVRLRHFESAALRDTNVRGLMERIHVTTDPALAEPGKEVFSSPAIIRAELRSGARLRSVVHEMRGHPNRPLERAELAGKFHECAEGVLPRSKSLDLLAALDRIEELPSMRDLTRLSVP